MRLTRRTAVTVLSTLYLLALTILAAYALHSTRLYTLPIPSLLTALTVALPPLAGIALETTISLNSQLAAKNKLSRSNAFLWVIAVLLVYETAVVTLAGTHLYPGTSGGGWKCGLEAVWQRLYSAHDESPIRVIQDAFECCGLNSVRDRAYPFQNRNGHGADACLVRFERTQRCLEPWRAEERKVAVMLLVVPIAVFVWKFLLFALPVADGRSWLPSAIRLPGDGSSERRRIEYRDAEDNGAGGDEDSVAGEVRRLNNDSRLASQVEAGRMRPNGLFPERNEWARDDDD